MSQNIGYEIAYMLKSVGGGTIKEMVYAQSSHQAVGIVKAKYPSNDFLSGPSWTGNKTKSQNQLEQEAFAEKVKRESEIRNRQQENQATTDSKVNNSNSDESLYGLFKLAFFGTLGLLVVYFLYVLVVNIFNFNKISNYDFGLYFNNIKSFYTEGEYRTANKKININITSPNEFVGDVLVPKNTIFIYEGSKDTDNNATLIALSYYDDSKHIYGYYTQNQKNNALQIIDKKIDKRIKEAIKKMFQEELSKKVDLVQAKGKKVDDLESKEYSIVQHISNDDMTFLYKDEYKNEVELIEDKYYSDDNYQRLYTKIGEKYLK